MNNIQTTYDLDGIKKIIRSLCDSEGITEFELAKRAGLNPASIYNVMKKTNLASPGMRRSTLRTIGNSLGYRISFEEKENQIILTKNLESIQRQDNLDLFLHELKIILTNAGKLQLSDLECDLMKKTLTGLLSANLFRKG